VSDSTTPPGEMMIVAIRSRPVRTAGKFVATASLAPCDSASAIIGRTTRMKAPITAPKMLRTPPITAPVRIANERDS
jgi:hypothetical protein